MSPWVEEWEGGGSCADNKRCYSVKNVSVCIKESVKDGISGNHHVGVSGNRPSSWLQGSLAHNDNNNNNKKSKECADLLR